MLETFPETHPTVLLPNISGRFPTGILSAGLSDQDVLARIFPAGILPARKFPGQTILRPDNFWPKYVLAGKNVAGEVSFTLGGRARKISPLISPLVLVFGHENSRRESY